MAMQDKGLFDSSNSFVCLWHSIINYNYSIEIYKKS